LYDFKYEKVFTDFYYINLDLLFQAIRYAHHEVWYATGSTMFLTHTYET